MEEVLAIFSCFQFQDIHLLNFVLVRAPHGRTQNTSAMRVLAVGTAKGSSGGDDGACFFSFNLIGKAGFAAFTIHRTEPSTSRTFGRAPAGATEEAELEPYQEDLK